MVLKTLSIITKRVVASPIKLVLFLVCSFLWFQYLVLNTAGTIICDVTNVIYEVNCLRFSRNMWPSKRRHRIKFWTVWDSPRDELFIYVIFYHNFLCSTVFPVWQHIATARYSIPIYTFTSVTSTGFMSQVLPSVLAGELLLII